MNPIFDHHREMLHKLIDDLPKDKLPMAADIFEKMIEEAVSDEEIKEWNAARKEIENGESYSFDEVFGELEK